MRISIYDGILETHVGSSLERALVSRGHVVQNTGRIGTGFKFASDPVLLHGLNQHIDEVLAFNPDVIFVFRPASLPYALLQRIKSKGAVLVAWFSDDPVLWKLSYGPVVDYYDIVLHCGSEDVLSFYEHQHGRPTGVNFPFWTDSTAFPFVYGLNEPETDVMFLGNVHDAVRRQRYFDLAGLEQSLRIHGSVGADYYNIWGGYLDSDLEVLDAGSRARLAINIPQYFKDHKGLPTWFEGLDKLGSFQYPSRVIQYAAMGLPMISVVPKPTDLATFPEIACVSDIRDLNTQIDACLNSMDLADLSARTYARFQTHYSAASRVLALEAVLEDDSWRNLSALERTDWFTRFDGKPPTAPAEDEPAPEHIFISGADSDVDLAEILESHLKLLPKVEKELTVVLAGVGWANQTSSIWTIGRALRNLGHKVVEANPYLFQHCYSKDPLQEFSGVFDSELFVSEQAPDAHVVIIIGNDFVPEVSGLRRLAAKGTKFVNLANEGAVIGQREARLASLMDLTTLVNRTLVAKYHAAGFENSYHVPDLVDRDFIRMLSMTNVQRPHIGVLAEKEPHIGANRSILDDFKQFPSRQYIAQEHGAQRHALANVARTVRGAATIVLPDTSRKGPLPNRLLGHAMFGGGIPIVPRGIAPAVISELGTDCVAIGAPAEGIKKFRRLLTNPQMAQSIRVNALRTAISQFAAEERIQLILDSLFPREESHEEAGHVDILEGEGATLAASEGGQTSIRCTVKADPLAKRHDYVILVDGAPVYEHRGVWRETNVVDFTLDTGNRRSLCVKLDSSLGVKSANAVTVTSLPKDFPPIAGTNVSFARSPFGAIVATGAHA